MNENKSIRETRTRELPRWRRWRKKQVMLQVWRRGSRRVIRSRKQDCNFAHSPHDDRRAKKPEKKDESNERN